LHEKNKEAYTFDSVQFETIEKIAASSQLAELNKR
jgi:hypothetical protein